MKAIVDQDVCIGSGNCEATCPEVFELKGGKSQAIKNPVPEDQGDRVREAVNGRPVGAISTA
jgi:ferredoxin